MAETIETNTPQPTIITPCFENEEPTYESFTISAEEAADILGVNRSRLSQLTSKGIFSFEKRKIDTRNRLFYKLSELLNHQRNQFQQNYSFSDKTYKELPKEEMIKASIEKKEDKLEFKNIVKNFAENKRYINKNLKSAYELYQKEKKEDFVEETNNKLKEIYEKQTESNEYIIKQQRMLLKEKNYFQQKANFHDLKFKEIIEYMSLINKQIQELEKTLQQTKMHLKTQYNSKHWKQKKAKYITKLTSRR